MGTKKIIIIVIALILVYVSIISFIPKKEVTPYKNTVGNPGDLPHLTCEERCKQDISCLEACYYVDINKAVVSGDINSCNKLNSLVRQSCIDKINFQRAFKTKDSSLCNTLVTQSLRELCLGSLKWIKNIF